LELSRAQAGNRQLEHFAPLPLIEIQSSNGALNFTRANQFGPQIPAHALASLERRDHADDFDRDRPETNVSQHFVDNDREWHFDSLQGFLKPAPFESNGVERELVDYPNRAEEQSRSFDR
jgi:hypothetical protein